MVLNKNVEFNFEEGKFDIANLKYAAICALVGFFVASLFPQLIAINLELMGPLFFAIAIYWLVKRRNFMRNLGYTGKSFQSFKDTLLISLVLLMTLSFVLLSKGVLTKTEYAISFAVLTGSFTFIALLRDEIYYWDCDVDYRKPQSCLLALTRLNNVIFIIVAAIIVICVVWGYSHFSPLQVISTFIVTISLAVITYTWLYRKARFYNVKMKQWFNEIND